jgi:hypothetical protein
VHIVDHIDGTLGNLGGDTQGLHVCVCVCACVCVCLCVAVCIYMCECSSIPWALSFMFQAHIV